MTGRLPGQRQLRGTGSSVADRLAVSVYPGAPIPELFGLGRWVATLFSTASRIKAAIDVRRSAAIVRTR